MNNSTTSSNGATLPPQAATPTVVNSKRTPHPQATEICDQIDHWFSDENIRKDQGILNHLNSKGDNSIINVYRISGRLKHKFDPKPSDWQIIDACRNSTMVDVIDKSHIRRKMTYVLEDSDDDGVWGDEDERPRLKPVPVHPGIKAGTFMKTSATGFEANFADAPMTPKEAEEENELYSEDSDIPSRIGHAIERFGARRKFTSAHQRAFANFLRFGGVFPASRIGQGDSKKQIMENEELSKEEKLELCAQYDVDVDDKLDDTKWVVDFEGVAKAYLSTTFAEQLDQDYDEHTIDTQCDLLNNFYNYLLYHNVCPEHKHEIIAAQRITKLARFELKTIRHLSAQFPAPFSKACSVLFGGEWRQVFGQSSSWGDYEAHENPQMALHDAKVVVGAALTTLACDSIFDASMPDNEIELGGSTFPRLDYVDKRSTTIEVTAIERATDEARDTFNSCVGGKDIRAEPLGKLVCKYWDMPTSDEYDLPRGYKRADHKLHEYTFWLEDDILADCFIGMKMAATIYKLDVKAEEEKKEGEGVWVLDSVGRIYASFWTHIANEMCSQKTKFKGVEWNEEEALEGCKHEEADKARQVLKELNIEKKKEAMTAKAG